MGGWFREYLRLEHLGEEVKRDYLERALHCDRQVDIWGSDGCLLEELRSRPDGDRIMWPWCNNGEVRQHDYSAERIGY